MTTVTMNPDGGGVIANPPVSLSWSTASIATWPGVKVHLFMVGDVPMTWYMFIQLPTCRLQDMDPLCMAGEEWQWLLLGRQKGTNKLVRCNAGEWLSFDDDLIDERDRLKQRVYGQKNASDADRQRLSVVENELTQAEFRRIDALKSELVLLPRILFVGDSGSRD